MLPAPINLTAYRGDTWAQTFRFLADATPVDLSTATVESEARSRQNGVSVTLPLDVTVEDPATDGKVTLRLPQSSLDPGVYDYDVEVTDGGHVTTWVHGQLTVRRDVTNELPL